MGAGLLFRRQAIFDGCAMASESAHDAKVRGGSFMGADMGGWDMTGSELAHTDWVGAITLGMGLGSCDLRGADFTGCDLTGTFMANANVDRAIFTNAVLVSCDLSNCNITDASIDFVDFTNAYYPTGPLPVGWVRDMTDHLQLAP